MQDDLAALAAILDDLEAQEEPGAVRIARHRAVAIARQLLDRLHQCGCEADGHPQPDEAHLGAVAVTAEGDSPRGEVIRLYP